MELPAPRAGAGAGYLRLSFLVGFSGSALPCPIVNTGGPTHARQTHAAHEAGSAMRSQPVARAVQAVSLAKCMAPPHCASSAPFGEMRRASLHGPWGALQAGPGGRARSIRCPSNQAGFRRGLGGSAFSTHKPCGARWSWCAPARSPTKRAVQEAVLSRLRKQLAWWKACVFLDAAGPASSEARLRIRAHASGARSVRAGGPAKVQSEAATTGTVHPHRRGLGRCTAE